MKKIVKITALLLSVVLVIASFASCSTGGKEEESSTEEASSSSASGDMTDITVCLDWTPNTNHTGLFVAKEKGYYADEGLNVTIVQPPENGSVQACAAGQAQFAVDAQDTLAAAFTSDTPLGVEAVAALIQHNTSGIISKKGEGMDRPKGLEGKTYLTWNSPIELAMMQNVVESDGGDWSKVKVIPNDVTAEAEDVEANPDHAIWVFYGWGKINGDIKHIDTDFFYFKDINPVFDYYTPVLIGNTEYMEKNPEITKKFLAATEKGYEYAISDPDSAAEILVKADTTHSLDGSEELVKASQEYLAKEYVSDAKSWGYIDPARWNAFYSWLYTEGLIEKELPAGTGFTDEYLPQK